MKVPLIPLPLGFCSLFYFLKELETLMEEESLKVRDVIEVYLPAPACSVWPSKDVVLIDRYVRTI